MYTLFYITISTTCFGFWVTLIQQQRDKYKGIHVSEYTITLNHLPQYIKALTNDHKYFKSTLKRFLYHHSFYSMNGYYEYKEDRRI